MEKREIMFRGWNKKNKRWLYGYYVVNGGEHFISPGAFVNDLEFYEDYVVEADTVGQYTGLKDKKGKKRLRTNNNEPTEIKRQTIRFTGKDRRAI